MSRQEIDGYLAALDAPKRDGLEALRTSILEVVPDADECISYGMPAFKVQGKTVAGFAAFKDHLSYLPHSGSVLAELGDEVARYETSKGSLKFAIGKPHTGTVFDEGMWAPSTPLPVASGAQATRAVGGGQPSGPGIGEAQHAVRND